MEPKRSTLSLREISQEDIELRMTEARSLLEHVSNYYEVDQDLVETLLEVLESDMSRRNYSLGEALENALDLMEAQGSEWQPIVDIITVSLDEVQKHGEGAFSQQPEGAFSQQPEGDFYEQPEEEDPRIEESMAELNLAMNALPKLGVYSDEEINEYHNALMNGTTLLHYPLIDVLRDVGDEIGNHGIGMLAASVMNGERNRRMRRILAQLLSEGMSEEDQVFLMGNYFLRADQHSPEDMMREVISGNAKGLLGVRRIELDKRALQLLRDDLLQ